MCVAVSLLFCASSLASAFRESPSVSPAFSECRKRPFDFSPRGASCAALQRPLSLELSPCVFSLTGTGALTARRSSLEVLEDALFLLQEASRVRLLRNRREHPPTYGLRWPYACAVASETAVGCGDETPASLVASRTDVLSALADGDAFCESYAKERQRGVATTMDAAPGGSSALRRRALAHTAASYCEASSRPALSFDNDYYEPMLGGWRGAALPKSLRVESPRKNTCADASEVQAALRRTLCLFPPKQLIQDDCGKLIVMV